MKVKKYLVKSMDEALFKIKKELGEDAYILSQKRVKKKGALNLAETEWIEVTAAIDRVKSDSINISKALLNKKYASTPENPFEKFNEKLRKNEAPDEARNKLPHIGEDFNIDALKNELAPIRKEVESLRSMLKQFKTDEIHESMDLPFDGIYMDLYQNLIENEVDKHLAKRIINSLQYQTMGDGISDISQIKKHLYKIVCSLISQPSPITHTPGQRKIITLVGPTGVGKTTTIAKLAAYFKLMENKSIVLMTIDGYRIGAEAHLRIYSEILDVPFYSIYNRNELQFRLESLQDADLIFLDTTGRSSNDEKGLNQMEQILSCIPPNERDVFLLLSATTKNKDLKEIVKGFTRFNPDKLIFSKIDETVSLGNLFNIKMKNDIPAAYFTTGQKVPEDIEIAFPKKFAQRILNPSVVGETV